MSDQSHRSVTQVGPSIAPKLEVTRGENSGERFTIKMNTRIGRERDNDVILLDLKSSRHHAEIELKEGQWQLIDLNSANGTYLNGAPLKGTAFLKNGDQISIGETELVFTLPVRDADAEPTPGPPQPEEVPRRGEASQPVMPVQPGQSSRLPWIAGGAILVLFLVAVFVVYLIANRTPEASPAVSGSTPASATQSAAQNQNGSGEDSATPASRPVDWPIDLSLVYEDDFSDSFGGWDDAFDAYTRKVYGNNRYNIEVYASNLVAWGLANRIVSDFELEVEAKLEEGDPKNSYGLLFRFEDRDNFYRYDISGDGYYLFSKFVDGEWITVIDWTKSEFINTGTVPNILKVSALGSNITLWANGQQLTSVSDDSLSRGNFGFFSGTFGEPYMWVSFDNLKMWTPPEEEIVSIPTATPPGAGAVAEAPSPTPTSVVSPATSTPESLPSQLETESSSESPVATPTAIPSPTPTVTPTPVPLPEYASRDQTLARGEAQESGRIIFPVFDPGRGIYDIYIADIADGSNLQRVQQGASQPTFNADGTQIAYRSWQPDQRGLFARALDSAPEDGWRFDLFFESARPQFSSINDSLIYFSRTGGRDPAVYRVFDGVGEVMRRDGTPIQGKAPKWSPDGQQIVYSSCQGSLCGIMLTNVDGSAPRLLTDNPNDTNPELSPDGSKIVFMSNRAGNWEIYSIDPDGENLEALTTDTASDGLPTWSPDGSKIAFVSNRDGEWSIWVMNPDGSNKRRQFVVDGPMDGVITHDPTNSFGWVEENIDWTP